MDFIDEVKAMKGPEWAESFDAYSRTLHRRRVLAGVLFGWTLHIPFIGSLIHAFWTNIVEEGLYQTIKPRWGMLTFAFLNDGMKPTVWHTWRQITKGQDDPYTGIYVSGAPKSLKQAEEWEEEYLRARGRAMNSMNVLLPLVSDGHDDLSDRGYQHIEGKDMDCRKCAGYEVNR